MLCDGCHENEAVVFYTEIINGEKKELHLCEACAAKETGMDHSFVSLTDTSFLANLLASVLGKRQETDDEEKNALSKIEKKNLDFIVLSSLKDKGAGFQYDTNKIAILSKNGTRIDYPLKLKQEVASDIVDATLIDL